MEALLVQVERDLQNVPEGHLRIAHKGNVPQFYYCTRESRAQYPSGRYISKENRDLAERLAQRDYNLQVQRVLKEQLHLLATLQDKFDSKKIFSCYDQLSDARKKLVTPCVLSDEDYVQAWMDLTYEGKTFAEGAPEIYTERGERVRSKSEKIIADKLNLLGVPYRYEYPLYLKGYGTVYPDFTILHIRTRQECYLEHLGMMDNQEYCNKALRKIELYEHNGIFPGKQLLLTHETSAYPLNTKIFEKLILDWLNTGSSANS